MEFGTLQNYADPEGKKLLYIAYRKNRNTVPDTFKISELSV
jgi:hypothetical protein